jgi:hypothetical protein
MPIRVSTSRTLLALVALLVLLALPSTSHASAEYTEPINNLGCQNWNSGGRDASQVLYFACNQYQVRIVQTNGSWRDVSIDTSVGHVAPSPNGAYLYSIDSYSAKRFVRGADGNYRFDPNFTFQSPPGWAINGWRVCGWGIATDAYGKVYISNGGWCPGHPNQILKYRPDGTFMTAFGEFGIAGFKGDKPGLFRPNQMIAVTHDGSRVWIADQNNYRVQVFQRAANNLDYVYRAMWSGEGTQWDGQLGAVYGVAVDPWGYGYVSQTTTKLVWRLDPDARNPVLVKSYAGTSDGVINRPHTLAVDARGSVWVGEWGARIDRTTAVPGPLPTLPPEPRADEAAPTLSSISAPSETTGSSVTLTINASDDIGVTQLRLANENGNWGAWQAFASSVQVQLTDGVGTKGIYVQVRDAAGRESTIRSTTVQRRPIPDMADPVVHLTAPATTRANTVSITIDASDDIGVTHIRFASEEGTFSDWQAWSSGTRTIERTLTPGYGARIVAIQVHDAAWKTSATVQATIVVESPPPAPEPDPIVVAPTPAGTGTSVGATGDAALPVATSGGSPVIDHVAPRIVSASLPGRSCSRRIVLRLAASDNLGVRQVRIANEDGRFGAWRPWTPRLSHFLSAGRSFKMVYLQVRDGAGNVSGLAARRTRLVRC